MNLTDTAILVKRLAVIMVFFLVGFFIFKYFFVLVRALYLNINPPAPPPVTTIFGKLPPITVPHLKVEGVESIAYTVDTPTGKFPNLPIQAKVFAIPHAPATLLSESRARALAHSFSFNNEPTRVSSSELHFDDVPGSRTFDINIVTGNFNIATDNPTLSLNLEPGTSPTQAQAINSALGLFTNKQLLTTDYISGTQKTTLVKIVTGNLAEAGSISEAQLVDVSLFRQADKLNIYGADPSKGLIRVLISGNPQATYPLITYNSWPLETTKVGTYPLKSVDKAFSELKSGVGGYVYLKLRGQDAYATYSPLNITQVSVRTVELGYYDNDKIQNYLQPIYIFSGLFKTTGGSDGDFTAYVPAVDTSWISSPLTK
ncbi:MAG: hypothetical protein NT141_04210 [candidate division WWE3 bacterium]|nr:hypothetical protein [candidate division WWE3 bacterium]